MSQSVCTHCLVEDDIKVPCTWNILPKYSKEKHYKQVHEDVSSKKL